MKNRNNMNKILQRAAFFLGFSPLLLLLQCTTDQYSTTVITEEEVALTGQVVDGKGEGIPGYIAKLARLGFSDTTDANGRYEIKKSRLEIAQALLKDSNGIILDTVNYNLETLMPTSRDSLLIMRDDSVFAALKFTKWKAELPTVVIKNRDITCEFNRVYTDILKGEAVISIKQDDTLFYDKTVEIWYDSTEHYLSGNTDFIYQGTAVSNYSLYVNIFDKAGRFVGRTYTKPDIPISAGQIRFTGINPFNALPTASAGNDTTVSINDTVLLSGNAIDTFGGTIVRYEWKIGADSFFIWDPARSAHQYVFRAPPTATPSFHCILRVTDNDGNQVPDTMVVKVVTGAPEVSASAAASTVSIKDTIRLQAAVLHHYGSIVSWEWDFGGSGRFVTLPFDSIFNTVAPDSACDSFKCIVRVTDDDRLTAEDTVFVSVLLNPPTVRIFTTTYEVSVNEQIVLTATGSDINGSIVKWEWDVGATGAFVETTPRNSITLYAPATPVNHYLCVVRATDDDGNHALDTMELNVVLPPPLIPDGRGHPMVSPAIARSVLDSIAEKGFAVVQSDWMGTVMLACEPSASSQAPKRRHFSFNGEYVPQVFEQSLHQWRDGTFQRDAFTTSFDLAFISSDIKIVVLNDLKTRVVGDINGDLYDDRFAISSDHASIWLGSANAKPYYIDSFTIAPGYVYGTICEYRWGHFLSTSRTDMLHVIPGNSTIDIWAAGRDGRFTLDKYTPVGSPDENAGVGIYITGDFDGNGYTDIVHVRDPEWASVWQNNARANPRDLFIIKPRWFPFNAEMYKFLTDPASYQVADFDGDGIDDIIYFSNYFNGTTYAGEVYFGMINTMQNFDIHYFLFPDGYLAGSGGEFSICDVNNDSKADMIRLSPGQNTIELWHATGIRGPNKHFSYIGKF
jgi:hypothetical protein